MKSPKRVRIIVAVDDQILSQVAASVLRNQDFDLVAVHFLVDLERVGQKPDEYPSALRKQDLAKIEKFCSGIDIPLRVIDVTEEVLAQVYDPFWMATLTGAPVAPTLDWVSGFLLPKLSSLAKDYRAESFATGHLVRKLEERPCGILRYSEPLLDQSASFSRITDSTVLDHLLLPLGEVSYDRIVRLAREMDLLEKDPEDFDGSAGARKLLEQRATRGRWAFPENLLSNPNVQARAPTGYFQAGPVRSHEEITIAEHRGVPFFKVGHTIAEFPDQVVVEIRNPSRTIIIGNLSEIEIHHVFVQNLSWSIRPTSPVRDFKVSVQAFGERKAVPARVTLFPGDLGEVRLEAPLVGLAYGTWLVFYDEDRVIGSGKVAEIPPQMPIEKAAESE